VKGFLLTQVQEAVKQLEVLSRKELKTVEQPPIEQVEILLDMTKELVSSHRDRGIFPLVSWSSEASWIREDVPLVASRRIFLARRHGHRNQRFITCVKSLLICSIIETAQYFMKTTK
jgi:hypothetical protein